jgi:hypothetical protein
MGPAYRLGSEQDIMYEITESGPVQGTVQHLEVFLSQTANIFARYLVLVLSLYETHKINT